MPNKTNTVSPFYDQEPGAPPPFPPMLTDQLELFDSAHRSTMLVSDEILPSRISTVDPPQHIKHLQLEHTPAPEFKLAARPFKNDSSSSPYSKRVSFDRSSSRTPMLSDYSSSLDSMSESGSSTSTESLSEESKIPKPPGEPGRPGRGGYTLNEALDWNPKAYAKFKKSMHHLIGEHLDTTKCASSQNHELLKVVRDKAVDAFPDLENYKDFWPLNDMIMMRLKYTSGRARQTQAMMVAGKSKSKTKKDPSKAR